MAKSFFISDELKDYFNNHTKQYYISLFATIVALVFGVILAFSDYNYLSILNDQDKLIFDYILGSVDRVNIFYDKLKNVILVLIITFLLNTNIYTSFLSFIYVGYQFVLLILSAICIISLYGLNGVLIVVFLTLPINLIYYFLIVSCNCVLAKRVSLAKNYKLNFVSSFKEIGSLKYICIIVILFLCLCLMYSYILPLFIKGMWFIIY